MAKPMFTRIPTVPPVPVPAIGFREPNVLELLAGLTGPQPCLIHPWEAPLVVPAAAMTRCFRQVDDDRLRQIIMQHPHDNGRLHPEDWQAIADKFGYNMNPRQIQERWYNYLRPGLDRSPFTLAERRLVATLQLNDPGKWEWIAGQLGNGICRSPTMVKQVGTNIIAKLKRLGFEIQTSRDIAFVPDAFFETGSRSPALVEEFRENKARHTAAIEREATIEAGWGLGSLLARPFTKQ
jgi:hypothetical protein